MTYLKMKEGQDEQGHRCNDLLYIFKIITLNCTTLCSHKKEFISSFFFQKSVRESFLTEDEPQGTDKGVPGV